MYAFFYIPLKSLFSYVLLLCVVNRVRISLSPIFAVYVSFLYLLGMYRSEGVDINAYRRAYENIQASDIFDPGFNTMMLFSQKLNLPFEIFLLSFGVINLLLLRFCCSRFNVNFGIVLAILALHLFLVRDFSQLRVGLAVNLVLVGYLAKGKIRYFFYLLGISIQLTSVVLIGLFISYEFQKRKIFLIKILPFLIIMLTGFGLSYLAFLDPRIDIYLNWNDVGYGNAISSFNILIFTFLFLFLSLYRCSFKIDIFVFSFLFSGVVFLSFSDVAIFSYRLTNICMSLYPFLVAKILKESSNVYFKILTMLLVVPALAIRPGSVEILEVITLGIE